MAPPACGLGSIVSATLCAKFAVTVVSPMIITVVLEFLGLAIEPLAVADQLSNVYPGAAVAVMAIARPVLCDEVPTAGAVVPPSAGETAIVRLAASGINAKFAVMFMSLVTLVTVSGLEVPLTSPSQLMK